MRLTVLVLFALSVGVTSALGAYPWYNSTPTFDTTATDWMAQLPDSLLISELSVPGTHESHNFDGPSIAPWCGICQTVPFHIQLQAGLRAFDIRLRHSSNVLWIYHAQVNQYGLFTDSCTNPLCGCGGVLAACVEFLDAHPGEAVFLRVKPNCGSNLLGDFYCHLNDWSFSEAVESALATYAPAHAYQWPIDDCEAMPTLGEVRGKIVILQDFIGDYHVADDVNANAGVQKGRVLCARDLSGAPAPDLAVLSQFDGAYIGTDDAVRFHNNGDATFGRGQVLRNSYYDNWSSISAADFDSNGYDDLVLTANGADRVDIYFYSGSGLSTSVSYGVGSDPISSATADFDADGDVDILVTAWGTNYIYLLRNNGDATFAVVNRLVGNSPYGITVANLNNDQYPDFVTTHQCPTFPDSVKAWLGPPENHTLYNSPGMNLGYDRFPEQVVARDFDGDGLDDVVVSLRIGYVLCLRNTGTTLFEEPAISVGGDPRALAVEDVNEDGLPDVIVADVSGSAIRVYGNDGDFGFPTSYAIPVGFRNPVGLSTEDFDGDADFDIAVAEWGPQNDSWGLDRTYVLRNQRGGSVWCPGKALGPYWNYLKIQDSYTLRGWGYPAGVAHKVDLIKEHLQWARSSAVAHPESLFVNFLSGVDWRSGETSCRIAPNAVAEATNWHTYFYLADSLNAGEVWRCGLIMADFPGEGLIDAVIGHNRYGRYALVEGGLPGVTAGAVAWGDYDSDEDLDILITGWSSSGHVASVYRNDGAGGFSDIGAGLTGVVNSAAGWGDYDNDGDLDFALSGDTGAGYVTRVYRNDAGTFADIVAGLPGATYSALAWGDGDNDGDLDLALSGRQQGWQKMSRIYRNDSGAFVDVSAGLTWVEDGTMAWGDYDNDGDLDLLLTGQGNPNRFARVYRNDGSWSFVDGGAGLVGVASGSAAWGDYDNDGDLDIALTGDTGAGYAALVYRNDAGTFSDIAAVGFKGVTHGSAEWGDEDNDGDLDLLLTGTSSEAHTGEMVVSRIYRNDGGSFSREFSWIVPVTRSSVAWGDQDADGDLDILVTGEGYLQDESLAYHSAIYRNDHEPANTPPSAPTNVHAQVAGSTMTISWDAATDAETPSAGLTYNLRVGTTPGGEEICAAMADAATGFRKIPALGNTNHDTSWTIELPDPVPSSLYFSVQAVDACFAASPFVADQGTGGPAPETAPTNYVLYPVAPNPFGSGTAVRYDVPRAGKTRLEVFDVTGRRVRVLLDRQQPVGRYSQVWNGQDASGVAVAPGVYFVRLVAGEFSAVQKVVRTR